MMNYFKKNKNIQGFTIVELLVSIGIFAMMTALLLAKYGTFNQGVILTNLAYDVAITIRNAQSYGLNVRSASRTLDKFEISTGGGVYGVHFSNEEKMNNKFQFFVDSITPPEVPPDGIYQVSEKLSETTIQRGSIVKRLCIVRSGSVCENIAGSIDITFARPDPNARIKGTLTIGGPEIIGNSAEITLQATDGSTKTVQVNSTGQISVK